MTKTYQQEEQEAKEVITGLGRDVAAAMGWTYTPSNSYRAADLVDPENEQRRITLRLLWNDPNRVMIDGVYPRDRYGTYTIPYGADTPQITCSIRRGGEKIAKDIARRFLPDYLSLLALVEQDIARVNAYVDKRDAFAQELAHILGEEPKAQGGDVEFHFSNRHGCFADIRVYADSVRIDRLSVPADVAKNICRVLAWGDVDVQDMR